jgi:hypothetical protein
LYFIREFDALRHFLLLQDPYNTGFKEFCDAKFPGKHLLGLASRAGLLQQRIEVIMNTSNFSIYVCLSE